jgi:hypothetical protein
VNKHTQAAHAALGRGGRQNSRDSKPARLTTRFKAGTACMRMLGGLCVAHTSQSIISLCLRTSRNRDRAPARIYSADKLIESACQIADCTTPVAVGPPVRCRLPQLPPAGPLCARASLGRRHTCTQAPATHTPAAPTDDCHCVAAGGLNNLRLCSSLCVWMSECGANETQLVAVYNNSPFLCVASCLTGGRSGPGGRLSAKRRH